MDVNGLVGGLVTAVNPVVPATLKASTGYTTQGDGSQVPTYATAVTIQVQVQPLTWRDLAQVDALNVQGEKRAVYIAGAQWDGVSRVDKRGGDLVTFSEVPGGAVRTWLMVLVLEQWPDWTKVAVVLQDD